MANDWGIKDAEPATVFAGATQINGFLQASGVANFRGIQYATVPERFRQSRLLNINTTGQHQIDATKWGPRCPQPIDIPHEKRLHIFEGVQPVSDIPMHEFDCLRLNIYTPPGSGVQSRLPVLFWIHGGGWTVGDGGAEFDGSFLVGHAIKVGHPIVFVSINYRLGYYGFLASRELKEEAERHGEEYFANQGMYDQRVALQWVQKNIKYFGGDESRVTLAGESAGAWSVFAHLLSDAPLFQRGIIMSCPIWTFPDTDVAQETFDRLVASTGVPPTASGEEKLRALRRLTNAQIEELLNGQFTRANWDPNWFRNYDRSTAFEAVTSFPSWIQGIVAGWTLHEMALFFLLEKGWSTQKVVTAIKSALPENTQLADEIIQAYNLDSDSPLVALDGFLQYTGEALFELATITLAENVHSPTILAYRFDQKDTFPNSPFRGYAFHSFDNVFMCRLPAVAGPDAQPELLHTADAVSTAWCQFAHGERPWPAFRESGKLMVFDGKRSKPVDWPAKEIWRSFVDTEERAKDFKRAAYAILAKRNPMVDVR